MIRYWQRESERVMATSPSPATLFYQFLEAAAEEGIEPPHGTRHITVDLDLCGYLAEEVLNDDIFQLSLRIVIEAFRGVPVKQAFGVVTGSMAKIDDILERDKFLRNYARRQQERRSA